MNNTCLSQLHESINTVLDNADGKPSKLVVEEIVGLHELASDELWINALDTHPASEQLKTRFTAIYNDYIAQMEHRQAYDLLKTKKIEHFNKVASDDAVAAYDRVGDLFKHVEFNHIKSVVMIGSGKLPVTALHIIDRTAVDNVVCLDILPESIEMANQLKDKFGWTKISFECCDGSAYDFSNADFIYVANMVRPKKRVLKAILESCKPDASIVVREPYGLGQLWAEPSADAFKGMARIIAYGEGSRFLSRDMFLTLQR